MVEVSIEVGDVSGQCVDRVLVSVAAADDHAELFATDVVTLVQSTNSTVLRLSHERLVVGLLGHPLVVEELSGEGAIDVVVSEVGLSLIEVEASGLTLTLANDPSLTDDLGDGSVVLSA